MMTAPCGVCNGGRNPDPNVCPFCEHWHTWAGNNCGHALLNGELLPRNYISFDTETIGVRAMQAAYSENDSYPQRRHDYFARRCTLMTYWESVNAETGTVYTVIRRLNAGYERYDRGRNEWVPDPTKAMASGIGGNGNYDQITKTEADSHIARWKTTS